MRRLLLLAVPLVLICMVLLPSSALAATDSGSHTWDHTYVTVTLAVDYNDVETNDWWLDNPTKWTLKVDRTDGSWVVDKVTWMVGGIGKVANSTKTKLIGFLSDYTTPQSFSTYTYPTMDLQTYTKYSYSSYWLDTAIGLGWHWLSKVELKCHRAGSTTYVYLRDYVSIECGQVQSGRWSGVW